MLIGVQINVSQGDTLSDLRKSILPSLTFKCRIYSTDKLIHIKRKTIDSFQQETYCMSPSWTEL